MFRAVVTLEKADWQVPDSYVLGESTLVPLLAGQTLHWRIRD